MSAYLRFEYASADALVAAGEDVRWLPRGRTAGLLLPALDLWLFDATMLRYHLFDGDGRSIADVNDDNPATAARYARAWAAAWERATPHADYKPG